MGRVVLLAAVNECLPSAEDLLFLGVVGSCLGACMGGWGRQVRLGGGTSWWWYVVTVRGGGGTRWWYVVVVSVGRVRYVAVVRNAALVGIATKRDILRRIHTFRGSRAWPPAPSRLCLVRLRASMGQGPVVTQ